MKANTTVFVGNITDKANDSLVRQILLVNCEINSTNDISIYCPFLEVWLYCWMETGTECIWKASRYCTCIMFLHYCMYWPAPQLVFTASFNVAFGFCEYSDPECTLRAMRLLNNFKLGDKKLVVSAMNTIDQRKLWLDRIHLLYMIP